MKRKYNPVPLPANFVEMEKRILADWYASGVVEEYIHKNDKAKKTFSFIDGPITANGAMGVHHAWGRTYKDLWQRYKNMQGFAQRFQNGFDCQGLWVEVEVEKELGFKTKKDIEGYGIANFVNKCKERVKKFSALQTEQSKRLGYFMDWENSYYTMSDENNYTIWRLLKICWERGWIYKGHDSVPWCPRCETAISQHEMLTEDYQELTHESVILEFEIIGRESEFLLVWTTTPWTIPANVAVAVDPKIEYSLVTGDSGDHFWVARELVDSVFKGSGKIEKTVLGRELVGLKYKSIFDDLPAVKTAREECPDLFHSVVATDDMIMPISVSEGTGMVHTAPSAGEEDHKLGVKLGLPMIPVIADDASYLDGLGEFSQKNAKENPRIILDYLENRDKSGDNCVFRIFSYTHRYPACWRCKAELVWKVADEWYIAMDKKDPTDKKGKTLREQMKDTAKEIRWFPGFGLERELDWLSNMHDWLISKKNRYWGLSLPIYECKKCGHFEVVGGREELKEKSVSGWDKFEGHTPHRPWIDEITIKCPKCGGLVQRILDVGNPWLDAGIVPYSTLNYQTDQKYWGKWFPADFITESFPGQFKNWFYSLIAQSTILEKHAPFKAVLGHGTLLGEDGRPMHKSWGNSIDFNDGAEKIGVDVMRWVYLTHTPEENLLFGYKATDEARRRFFLMLWNVYSFFVTYANLHEWKFVESGHILDLWIKARLSELQQKTTAGLDDFAPAQAAREIEKFVSDLSTWYIRRSRDRMNDEFFSTCYHVLTNLCLILAPFTPYIAEEIYRNLTGEKSVHLASWPQSGALSSAEKELIVGMQAARDLVEKVHAERKNAGIKLRQPLRKLTISNFHFLMNDAMEQLIKDELNIKDIEVKAGKGELKIELDINLTPELVAEGKARDLVRDIQEARKTAGTALNEIVDVELPDWPEEFSSYIKEKTMSGKLVKGPQLKIIFRK